MSPGQHRKQYLFGQNSADPTARSDCNPFNREVGGSHSVGIVVIEICEKDIFINAIEPRESRNKVSGVQLCTARSARLES
jgi:hypothetical protein